MKNIFLIICVIVCLYLLKNEITEYTIWLEPPISEKRIVENFKFSIILLSFLTSIPLGILINKFWNKFAPVS